MLRTPLRALTAPQALTASLGAHGWLEHALAALALRYLHRVVPVEAGAAERLRPLLGRRDELLERHEAERVGPDRLADLLDRAVARDELVPRGKVDAVEARPLHRRRGDAHVHLEGACLAHHRHDRLLGVPPDD